LLIDVGALRGVEIDAAHKTALAQPGVRGRELTEKLARQGLAFPCGHCSTVPLAGYLLGGGFGWNAGEWGVACWNVTGVDVVTAGGELLHADENDHADLFWAARGAGPGFVGVIVGYRLRLFELPTAIETTTLVYPLEKAGDLARWAARTGPQLARNVELVLLCVAAPAHLTKQHSRVCTVTATAFARSHQEALAALQPIAACPVEGALAREVNAPASFDSLFGVMDAAFPDGKRCAMDTLWLAGDAGELLARAAAQYERAPSPRSLLLCVVPPPPPADAPPLPDCAFSMVGPVNLGCYAIWDEESADEENVAWLRRTTAALSDATIGYYVGETDFDAGESRSRRSFSEANWQRLAELRKKHDPTGLFHDYAGRGPE
jgi:FAD/FMN-containing dehydrogenase